MVNTSKLASNILLQGHQGLNQLPGGWPEGGVFLQARRYQLCHLGWGFQRHMQVPQAAAARVLACEQGIRASSLCS